MDKKDFGGQRAIPRLHKRYKKIGRMTKGSKQLLKEHLAHKADSRHDNPYLPHVRIGKYLNVDMYSDFGGWNCPWGRLRRESFKKTAKDKRLLERRKARKARILSESC